VGTRPIWYTDYTIPEHDREAMTVKWHVGAVGMALMIAATSATVASSTYGIFLKVDGIAGESTAAKHMGEIGVLSFSFGVTNTGTQQFGGGGGAGKTQVQDLHVVKRMDKASPRLFLAAASGEHIGLVRLACDDALAQTTFCTVTLEDVFVSSTAASGNPAADETNPTEEVTFRFARVTWEYRTRFPNGAFGSPVSAGWDVKANASIRTVGAAPVPDPAPAPGPVVQAGPKVKASRRPNVILRPVIVPGM
jgi:type VI secretion system secreted protein Hcp